MSIAMFKSEGELDGVLAGEKIVSLCNAQLARHTDYRVTRVCIVEAYRKLLRKTRPKAIPIAQAEKFDRNPRYCPQKGSFALWY